MNFSIRCFLFVFVISCSFITSQAIAKTDYYEAALKAYNLSDIDEAFIHLKNALQENEDNLPAKLLLAEVLIKKRSYALAEQELDAAIMQGADINLIIEPLGRSLLLQGKFDSILSLADETKLHKHGKLSFHLIKAKAYRGLSDIDAAKDLNNKVLSQYPNNIEAMLELASIYNTSKSSEKSQNLLDRVLLLAPQSNRLWQIKGQLARSQGQFKEAITYFSKANTLEPNNPATLRAMASSYIELKEPSRAETLIEQTLTLSPNDLQAQLIKSNILRSQDKTKLSNDVLIKLTNQLSSIDGSYMLSQPQLLLIDAMSSYGQGNWSQAQKKFQLYINQETESNDMSAVVLLADTHIKLDQPDLALRLLEGHESSLIKSKDYALILAGLYLQFDQNFKADYVLNKLKIKYEDDVDILILSAKVLSKRGKNKEALLLLESSNIKDNSHYIHTLAIIASRLGDLNKSLTYVRTLTSNSPEVIEYQLLYIDILLKNKQFSDAEKVIVDLYHKNPEDTQAQFSYAMLQFNLNNTVTAKAIFTELVTKNPDNSDSWFVLAQIAYDAGEVDEAIAILERQTKNHIYKNKALYKLAKVYYSQQQFEKSLSVINVLLKQDRLNTKLLTIKAKNFIALKQIKEAKDLFDILFELWGDDAPNLVRLSQLQLKVNDYIAAEKSLNIAYSLQPNALPVIINLIKLNIRLNKLMDATNVLVKAEQVGYQKNNYLIILKGDIELAKNNVSAAFDYYLTVLKNDDSNVVALIKLSKLNQTTAMSDKFIHQLNYLVDKYPDRAIQRHSFADHLFAREKFEQAKYQYQRLIVQNIPSDKRAWALNNLAIIYQREGAYQEAVEVSQQAFTMLSAPGITDTLGWSLTLSGEVNKGLTYLRQAYSMFSTSPVIQYHIAYALIKLNREDEAKRLLISIIELPDNFVEHQLAEQLLNSL